jgi:uncharacterized protein (TIGR03067 family)
LTPEAHAALLESNLGGRLGLTAKQVPHQPDTAPALSLRADWSPLRDRVEQDEVAQDHPMFMCRYTFRGGMLGMVILIATGTALSDSDKETVAARITRLIEQLGDDRFAQREAASKELEAMGERALAALRKAAASRDDPEIKRRAEQIIQMFAGKVTKRELEKLQGNWYLISYETDGKQIKGEDKAHVFIIEGDKWSIQVGGQVFQAGTVQRIELKEKFNAIDLLIVEGGVIRATAVSIYSLEGQSFKYLNGITRPTEFVTKEGDGRHYLTFRRAKP